MKPNKVFVLGLPRSGTTSVCIAALGLGFKTAHTAYTQAALDDAEFIADTPAFHDFELLDKRYPNSRFIYLSRPLALWLPSISRLLTNMASKLLVPSGGFNPCIKRCYGEVFSPLSHTSISDYEHLEHAFLRHQERVTRYFKGRESELLMLDISAPNSYQRFTEFLLGNAVDGDFVHVNKGAKVTAWNKIKHPLKVASTANGKSDLQ
jgi:hypothetical protein